MGGFNFPKLIWSNCYVSSISSKNGMEYEFFKVLNVNCLYQHVNIQTFKLSNVKLENTLYLIFFNQIRKCHQLIEKIFFANSTRCHLILCYGFILKENICMNNEGKIKFLYQKSDFTEISNYYIQVII